ncbi:MAG: CAP domain-containing protein [Chitinophagaceae bacterium]
MKRTFLLTVLACVAIFTSLISFSLVTDTHLVNDVLSQTNKFRRSKGLPALVINEDLNALAQKHSANMAKGRVRFGHGGFSQREAQAKRKINPLHSFAENVAFGPTTGKQVVTMWKNSSGHRRNMLGQYKYIGIGIAKDRRGHIYYTQVFAR